MKSSTKATDNERNGVEEQVANREREDGEKREGTVG